MDGPMTSLRFLLPVLLLPLAASAEPQAKPAAAAAEPQAAAQALPKVRLETSAGVIVLELDRAKAPVTVENFLSYVAKGHYNGTVFHRVIDGFMIQGGGFALTGGNLEQKPTGKPIFSEARNGLKNLRGTIAMARTADPDSATAQFFINVSDNAALDFPSNGGYTVFGKVVSGMETVDAIRQAATGTSPLTMLHPATGERIPSKAGDVPVEAVVIRSAKVE
jgi:peptidyl-prolyl cis-trans isomerase A (cyclophilin A)